MSLFRGLLLCMGLSLLVSCGGGGGSSSGGPRVSLSLQGGSAPVQSAAVQVIEVDGLPLTEETYPATVDGNDVAVMRGMDDELLLLLPPGLEAGTHELVVTIDGTARRLSFDSLGSTVAPRAQSLEELDAAFATLRSAADAAITDLQLNGGSQAAIDELIAHRNTLDTGGATIQGMTDAELHYLNQFFTLNITPASAKSAPRSTDLYPRGIEQCRARKFMYVRQFLRMVFIIGVSSGALDVAMMYGPAAAVATAAGAGVVIYIELHQTLDELDHLVTHCLNPVFNSLNKALSLRSAPALRETLVVDDGVDRIFENDLTESYVLESEFEFADEILDVLPDARTVISRASFLIPDDVENWLKDRLFGDFSEEVPVASMRLEQISEPDITGELVATGDTTFDLTFTKDTGAPFENEFTFVIYDIEHDIETHYTARLWSDGHCPEFTIDSANVVLTDDKCIVIDAQPEMDVLDYQEYQQQALVMREHYTVGSSPNIELKSLKGLDDHDHIPEMWVERISRYVQYTPLWEEMGRPSVRAREVIYSEEASDLEIIYSNPVLQLRGDYLEWDSVPKEELIYGDYPGIAYTRTVFTDPLQGDDYIWVSLPSEVEHFDLDGNRTSRTVYAQPVKDPQGAWTTVQIEAYGYSASGEITEEVIYHEPAFSSAGSLQAPESIARYFEGGALVHESIFSLPLQSTAGEWQSVLEERHEDQGVYNGSTERYFYSAPLQDAQGDWVSVVARLEGTDDAGGTHTEIRSEPQQTPWGEWQSVIASFAGDDGFGYSSSGTYTDPLQQPDGNWTSVMASSSTTWADGETREIIFSAPRLADWGEWQSVPALENRTAPGGSSSETVYSAPLQAEDGGWQSVEESAFNYLNGEMIFSAVYFDPIQLPNGYWDSALAESTEWNGDVRTERTWSGPLETSDFAQSVLKQSDEYLAGVLTAHVLYTNALQNDDGTWTSLREEERYYSGGTMTSQATYAAPQKPSSGFWGTSYVARTTWTDGGRTEYDYSSLHHAPDGSFVTSVLQARRAYEGSTLTTETLYSSPYLDAFDDWTVYMRRVNDYVTGCYRTYDQSGNQLSNTCS